MGLDKGDWSRWLKGLIGAGISGSSAAITSTISASMIAPDQFNLQDGLHNTMKLIATVAAVSFIVSISKYLSQKPLPEDDDEEKKP